MAKRKLHPALKAYSSCVRELGLNPRMLKKKGLKGAAAEAAAKNRQKLKACAEKKLRMMKR